MLNGIVPGSSQKLRSWNRFCPQAPTMVQNGHQLAWAVPCGPLTLSSVYRTGHGGVGLRRHLPPLPLCSALIPQALLRQLKFAVSCGGEWMCSWIRKGRDLQGCCAGSGLVRGPPWIVSAEGDP